MDLSLTEELEKVQRRTVRAEAQVEQRDAKIAALYEEVQTWKEREAEAAQLIQEREAKERLSRWALVVTSTRTLTL